MNGLSTVTYSNDSNLILWFLQWFDLSTHYINMIWAHCFCSCCREIGGVQTGDFGEAAFARASSSMNSFSSFNISFFSSFFFGLTLMRNFFFFFRAFLTLMVDVEHTLCAGCVIHQVSSFKHVLCTKPKVPILLQQTFTKPREYLWVFSCVHKIEVVTAPLIQNFTNPKFHQSWKFYQSELQLV